jgi:hypothetical protein
MCAIDGEKILKGEPIQITVPKVTYSKFDTAENIKKAYRNK